MKNDIIASAIKAAPPVTVTSLAVKGIALADWVLILTIVYTALQIVRLLCDWLKPGKASRR